MNAKEFIVSRSPEWSEAVDNGYDLRMGEPDILHWMEKYAKYKAENLPIPVVVGRSEQLVCEYCNEDDKPTCCDSCLEGMVNAVQKAN